ncbi:hypothetical protein [Saccharothrix xinjiangensis]|uniref:Uncharacterized protein n=1 Tax=Saccharothrix xinjiangensis TaxID=204798 RepID=A0ABV9Y5I7_9PSEU
MNYVLLGYRVMPPWEPGSDLPSRVVTCSDHLVNAQPDDDAWFTTPVPATHLLAVGVAEADFDAPLLSRLTEHPDRLLLTGRTPWPPAIRPLGHEVIGVEDVGFHSLLCYEGVVTNLATAGAHLNQHGLISRHEDARRAADAAGEAWDVPDLPWLPVVLGRPDSANRPNGRSGPPRPAFAASTRPAVGRRRPVGGAWP